MVKYDTLLSILDHLRREAPAGYKSYYPLDNDIDGLNKARSKAFIHLFLMAKFGLVEFMEREEYITEGPSDGGIDAYFIDSENRLIYLIQSKFRDNEKNFLDREILFKELVQMDIEKIIDNGDETDEKGVPYNDKIKRLIGVINKIPDVAKWRYKIIILANLNPNVTKAQLQKVVGKFETEVYNHERVYSELVFRVVQGTYYNPSELNISINLSKASLQSSEITYTVQTQNLDCDITVLFVPTVEIAKALYKYRNAILRYNPRSYLELANNDVNKDIARSITDIKTNEFALYNNGITVLSADTHYNKQIGKKDQAQLIIKQPQIINGGQTAFTLSRLYENCLDGELNIDIFNDKEVLLKIITLPEEAVENVDSHLKLIEDISKATNKQSPVDDADRRSNDYVQIKIQEHIFDTYGYFYERKRGEFADGVHFGYIRRENIIDREQFIRLCKCCDMEPASARRSSKKQLFQIESFNKTLSDDSRYKEYFFAYKAWQYLLAIEKGYSKGKKNRHGELQYGNGLLYGKYAIISACMLFYKEDESLASLGMFVDDILKQWQKFESYVMTLPTNSSYFRVYKDEETGIEQRDLNFDNYYKGKTLDKDILTFFKK